MHWFPKHGKSMDTFSAEVRPVAYPVATPVASNTPTQRPSQKKLYRVQVGAYSVKANANAMLGKIKAAGFHRCFHQIFVITISKPAERKSSAGFFYL
jgi:N-acetylmuramoyl-L-alanine amidase